MKKDILLFDLSGTLVQMRPVKLSANKALLDQLSDKYNLGIITGAKKVETKNILNKIKIAELFKFIITKDDCPYRKPDSRLLKSFKNMKIIGFIGDTIKDYLFAKNCNLDFYYVGKRKLGIYQNQKINKIINYILLSYKP